MADAFVKEYELNTTPKLLFPFISTADGLQEWFADKAETRPNSTFLFEWDSTDHLAAIDTLKLNKSVRFCFIDSESEVPFVQDRQHQFPFIEFAIVPGNFSQSVFLRVTDLTEASEDDIEETWDYLVGSLKDRIGG